MLQNVLLKFNINSGIGELLKCRILNTVGNLYFSLAFPSQYIFLLIPSIVMFSFECQLPKFIIRSNAASQARIMSSFLRQH